MHHHRGVEQQHREVRRLLAWLLCVVLAVSLMGSFAVWSATAAAGRRWDEVVAALDRADSPTGCPFLWVPGSEHSELGFLALYSRRSRVWSMEPPGKPSGLEHLMFDATTEPSTPIVLHQTRTLLASRMW
jgi:hypothetical protein